MRVYFKCAMFSIICMLLAIATLSIKLSKDGDPLQWKYSATPSNGAIAVLGEERFSFPSELRFCDTQWKRSNDDPIFLSSPSGVQFRYESTRCDDTLEYFQGTSNCDTCWSLAIQHKNKNETKGSAREKLLIRSSRKWDILYTPLYKGKFEGEMRYFYMDGTKKLVVNAQRGELHGTANAYRPDGTLWWRGVYKNNELDFDTVQVFGRNGDEQLKFSDERKTQIASELWRESQPAKTLSAEQFIEQVLQKPEDRSSHAD